jgi:hypothetical protein
LWDRIVGVFKAVPAEQVARDRARKARKRQPPTPPPAPPKPVRIPTEDTFQGVPEDRIQDFSARTATLDELEWTIMDPNMPLEVRRAAVEQWANVAPHPMRPNIPYISGVGHDHFWAAFRDAYHETEAF